MTSLSLVNEKYVVRVILLFCYLALHLQSKGNTMKAL